MVVTLYIHNVSDFYIAIDKHFYFLNISISGNVAKLLIEHLAVLHALHFTKDHVME